MQRVLNFLSSMGLTSILMLIFAAAAGVATFIENDYGTDTARALVYNARWFEAIMVLLAISLLINIIKQKLYQKPKLASGLMHASFIIILIGAGLTRYYGYEGMMHIREGEVENKILSTDTYLSISAASKGAKVSSEEKVLFAKSKEQKYQKTLTLGGKTYDVTLKEIIPNAVKQIVEVPNGKPMISLMIVGKDETPTQKLIENNSTSKLFGVNFEMGEGAVINAKEPTVRFFMKDSKIFFVSNENVAYMTMADKSEGNFSKNEAVEFQKNRLYSVADVNFVPKYIMTSAAVKLMPAPSKMKGQSFDDALIFDVKNNGETKTVTVMGQKQALGESGSVALGDANISINYGAKVIELPISLKLNDFILSRYPGSMSPSSYESNVTVKDGAQSFDYRIYMNHTLDAGGYRFFQSSYDGDEKGTVLSVSKDPGKIPTYIGYLLMGIAMIWLLIDKTSRFRRLNELLEKQKTGIAAIIAVLLLSISHVQAADENGTQAVNILENAKSVNKKIADEFGSVLIQDAQGRVKPINTLAIEIMDKVYGSDNFEGLNANQVLLGMILDRPSWQQIKFIKISHPELKKLLGIASDEKHAAIVDFIDMQNGTYKLASYVEEANMKKPSDRGTLDKEILKVDERINICEMLFRGKLLRMFPKPNDANNTWFDPASAIMSFDSNRSLAIRETLGGIFNSSMAAAKDESKAIEAISFVAKIKNMQQKEGAAVVPSEFKISLELMYNKLNIFKNLMFVYLLVGFALLIAEFATLSNESKALAITKKASLVVLIAGFVAHTLNLGARWYISGHAPWSDGFESMTYIAWATVLAGILFTKKSTFTLALTAILSGIILFVAHLSWMDPQITNIVPVLKSYWLTIHVSMITASYGFLGLGALIGFVSLILFMLRSESKPLIDKKIRELAVINEMTLIVGLFMLTIGNFLGGVWANESWGRYWGWDPKETWAFVSILIYAVVVHSRYIPKMNTPYALSVISMFAFSSIVMTYFGVNFYLSGLHSYAQGDPVPVPTFVYVSVAVMIAVAIGAFSKRDLKLIR